MTLFKKALDLRNHQGTMKYLKNTSWLLAEKVLRIFVGLFVGIWVARYLGPEQFGVFSYAQSFVGLFIALSTLGLDGIVVRELVNNPAQKDQLLGSSFVLKLCGAIGVLVLLAGAMLLSDNDTTTILLISIIASATIFNSFSVIDFYFQSKVLSKYVVYSNMFTLSLSSIIKITLILNEAPLVAFAYVVLFDSFVLMSGLLFFYIKQGYSLFNWKVSIHSIKSLLKDCWPLILSGFVVSLYMNIDQVMIKNMLDTQAVGQYAAAVRLSEAWYFVPMVISASLFPAILNARKVEGVLYENRLQSLYDLMVWLAISIALPMTFLADFIVSLLYGPAYNEAAGALVIHIWAGVFIFMNLASSKWFIAENLQKFLFYRALTGVVINILLNYLLIPMYGIQGAAISTLLAQFFASYLFNLSNAKLMFTFKLQSRSLVWPLRLIKLKLKKAS